MEYDSDGDRNHARRTVVGKDVVVSRLDECAEPAHREREAATAVETELVGGRRDSLAITAACTQVVKSDAADQVGAHRRAALSRKHPHSIQSAGSNADVRVTETGSGETG